MLESVFNKVAGFQACNFVKSGLHHRCYLVKFAKFLITLFFTEYLFTVTASVCSENLGKILVRNNSHVGRQHGNSHESHVGRQQLYRELHCRHSRGNFSKLNPLVSVAFMASLKFFELYHICAALSTIVKINNALILSFQNV